MDALPKWFETIILPPPEIVPQQKYDPRDHLGIAKAMYAFYSQGANRLCAQNFAQDEFGSAVHWLDNTAYKFCMRGLRFRIINNTHSRGDPLEQDFCRFLGLRDANDMADLNNLQGYAAVMELLKSVIDGD